MTVYALLEIDQLEEDADVAGLIQQIREVLAENFRFIEINVDEVVE